jgi:hypothetical protein
MIVFEGCPLFRGCRMSNLGPRISTRGGRNHGAQGRNGMSSLLHSSIYIYIYIYIYIFAYVFTVVTRGETKKRERGEGLSPTGRCQSLALLVGAPRLG